MNINTLFSCDKPAIATGDIIISLRSVSVGSNNIAVSFVVSRGVGGSAFCYRNIPVMPVFGLLTVEFVINWVVQVGRNLGGAVIRGDIDDQILFNSGSFGKLADRL